MQRLWSMPADLDILADENVSVITIRKKTIRTTSSPGKIMPSSAPMMNSSVSLPTASPLPNSCSSSPRALTRRAFPSSSRSSNKLLVRFTPEGELSLPVSASSKVRPLKMASGFGTRSSPEHMPTPAIPWPRTQNAAFFLASATALCCCLIFVASAMLAR